MQCTVVMDEFELVGIQQTKYDTIKKKFFIVICTTITVKLSLAFSDLRLPPSMLIHIWIEEKGSGRGVTTVVAG